MPPPDPTVAVVTVQPTRRFFRQGGVMFRAWEGAASDGTPVTMIVSAIRSEGELQMPGLVPIPPPDDSWSEAKREALLRLWAVASELMDEEAAGIATMAQMLASMPLSSEERRESARSFLAGLGILHEVAREKRQ